MSFERHKAVSASALLWELHAFEPTQRLSSMDAVKDSCQIKHVVEQHSAHRHKIYAQHNERDHPDQPIRSVLFLPPFPGLSATCTQEARGIIFIVVLNIGSGSRSVSVNSDWVPAATD